ncbi:hypothetical protein GF314_01130 [bacterium]|nr:hypothetical protein [bacterium]
MAARRDAARWLLPLVAVAGFTFLVYEVSWFRMLSLALGATVSASTIVLAVFMIGLGGGAWLWGRLARGRQRLDRWLAILLVAIAAGGLASHVMMASVIPGLHARPGFAAAPAAVIQLLAAVSLLGPTLLMGGVFPLASQLAARRGGPVAGLLGRLYAAETLGSTLGGLTAGFLLLGTLGQQGTMLVAVALNLVTAAGFARLGGATAAAADTDADAVTTPRSAPADELAGQPGDRATALMAAAATGLGMLALQVLWMRALRIYLTNTSYGFAMVASLVILGVFLGSALYARHGERLTAPRVALVRALGSLAVLVLLGLALLLRLPQTLMFPFEESLRDPVLRVLGVPALAALLVVLPPAICSGYVLPLACRLAARRRSTLGADVGVVMLVNTAGGAVGPVVAAFLLLPAVGVAAGVIVIAALMLAAAARAVEGRAAGRQRLALLLVAAALVATALTAPRFRFLPPSFAAFDRDLLFYRESVEGTLSVGQDRGGGNLYTFVNNSAVIGSSYDAIKVVKMVGHFPFLLGLDARDVLVVGFGIGVTTAAIAEHPSVERIDCVELVPGLREAAEFYEYLNDGIADDPRLDLIGGDGRHHLARTTDRYDLISCDPTHPILGSGGLYTTDYFELCREHLNPGGMVSQYLPLHKLGTDELLGLIGTFAGVFPHSTLWLGHFHAVLLGSTEPLDADFATWQARAAALGEDEHFYLEPYHLAATLVLDPPAMQELAREYPANTDDRSYTDFFDPDCLDPGNLPRNLRALARRQVEPDALFSGIDDPARMDRFVAGNRQLTVALYHRLAGNRRPSLAALQQAARVNPENEEYPFLMRLYFPQAR